MKENKKLKTEYFDGVKRKERINDIYPTTFTLIKPSLKLSLTVVASFLLLLSVSSVGGTVSYFSDTESTLSNYLRADPISFKVETEADQIDLSEEKKIDLIMTPDEISDPIQYFVTSKVISGDSEFCAGIGLIGSEPFPVNTTTGSLLTEVSTATGLWTITTQVPDILKIPGKSCEVEFTYLGWSDGSALGKSFTDTRKVTLLFFIPSTFEVPKVNFAQVVTSSEEVLLVEENLSEDNPPVVDASTDEKQEVVEVEKETEQPKEEKEEEVVVPTPTPTPSEIPQEVLAETSVEDPGQD